MSGDIEAASQLVKDALRRHIEVAKHDQRMKPQVCRLINQIIRLTGMGGVFGGNEGFCAFLTHFFQNLIQPFVMKAGDIG
jgi:hypothetical protein